MDVQPSMRHWIITIAAGGSCLMVGEPLVAQAEPEARAHHQVVYHAGESRVYMIGGSTRRGAGHHYFEDVWYREGGAWTQAAELPFPRSSHRLVYDPTRNSLILFGGGFGRAIRAEGVIWEWGEAGWKARGGNSRAAAAEPGMCYDRSRERVVIFGGWDDAGAFRGDTWEWDRTSLVQVDSVGPSARAGHALVYDPVRERCLVFGGRGAEGYHADTWEWDGTSWHRLEVTGPSPRWFFGAATDPKRGRIVIFGGRGPDAPVLGRDATGDFSDTWIWTGEDWQQLSAEGAPARSGGQLTFNGRNIVLFGGREERPEGFHDRNDLWELDRGSWVRLH